MDEHIPENEISLYAFNRDALPPARKNAIDQHAAACAECRDTLDFFMVTEEELRDADVWERTAGSATLQSLRAYAERIAAEDEDAERLLEPFLSSPAEVACTKIPGLGKRYMTGGVVRRLNAHAHDICESEPLDALTFADTAVTVAEMLPDNTYPVRGICELRGTAWRERARALHLLGRFNEALESLARAERAYRDLASAGFGLAHVALVRAAVLYEQQRLDEAAAIAEDAERGFRHLGDDERVMNAVYLRACIKLEAADLGNAIELYQHVLAYGEAKSDAQWIARASYAIGHCEVDRGRLSQASLHFHKALMIFRETGPAANRARAEWGLARVLLHGGRQTDAIPRLQSLAAEFEQRGMVTDAALVGIDMADALLATGEAQQIVDLTTRLFQVFTEAGMLTGALTAMAYLKEAAASGTLTPQALNTVRAFLRRVERQPDLVFVPPPDNFRSNFS